MDKKYVVAILGAQGAVGAEMIKTLEKRNFPVKELILLGATTTIGKKVKFKDSKVTISADRGFQWCRIAILRQRAAVLDPQQ